MNILERLEARCRDRGEMECLFDGTTSLCYSEVWKLSGRVYAYIKKQGVEKEQAVMISMDRNVHALVCIVGILRSHAAFVVMGQGYPEERKAYIRKDAGCVLEITEDLYKEILKTDPIDGFEERAPHDLAYLVHTSGTTGYPKCVMQEFGGIEKCRAAGHASGENIWAESDRMAVLSPINFVACIYQLFYALNCGATLVLVPREVTNNLNAYKKFLEDYAISAALLTPSLLKRVGKLPAVVRAAIIFGEAAKEVYDGDITIYNFYAQSELGSLGTFFKVDRAYDLTPIGRSCDSSAGLKVLDEQGSPVADGQEGELCLDLPYFRGYRNLPEATAKALSGGIYHTGDIVRKNEDGELVLLRRKDTMVKINGNRVELTEVENRMRTILGGQWTAVNACKNGNVTYLCAYYVDELPISLDELKTRMAESLATYMLPSFYVKLERIPLNDNGKFSRRLLPEPDFRARRKDYKAPVGDLQKKIVAAFEDALKLDRVGVDEDFFELGGDSLAAIGVITALGLPNLLTTDIFSLRTAEALAEKCRALMAESVEEPVCNVQPLAGTQNFMRLYHEKLAPSTAYNLSSFYRLKTGVDVVRLRNALSKVLHAHQVFRTTLQKTNGGIVQTLGETIREPEIIETTEAELKLLLKDLVVPYDLYEIVAKPSSSVDAFVPNASNEDGLFNSDAIETIASTDFETASRNNLLYKCQIFRTEAGAYLFFEMHHILTDGTSLQILLKEFQDAYAGGDIREDQYFRLIQNRVKTQNASSSDVHRDYYRRKMPGAGRLFMPSFDRAEAGTVPGIRKMSVDLTEADLSKIKERYGLAPTEFFIFCYLIALSRVTGCSKVGTAYTVSGRDSALAQNTVGLLLYSYYVNLDLDAKDSIGDLARKMRRELDEIQRHQGFDCTTLTTDVSDGRTASSNILYQGRLRDTTAGIKDLVEEEIELPNPHYKASYYLEFEILNFGQSMDIVLYYNASRFTEETAARMLATYRDVCREVSVSSRA